MSPRLLIRLSLNCSFHLHRITRPCAFVAQESTWTTLQVVTMRCQLLCSLLTFQSRLLKPHDQLRQSDQRGTQTRQSRRLVRGVRLPLIALVPLHKHHLPRLCLQRKRSSMWIGIGNDHPPLALPAQTSPSRLAAVSHLDLPHSTAAPRVQSVTSKTHSCLARLT